MRQEIIETHNTENAVPAGGETKSMGIEIRWQNGPVPRDENGHPMQSTNGAFVEGVIQAAIGRLKFYNSGKFSCRENSLAITHLEEALHWLDSRTRDRIERKVEGTHAV